MAEPYTLIIVEGGLVADVQQFWTREAACIAALTQWSLMEPAADDCKVYQGMTQVWAPGDDEEDN